MILKLILPFSQNSKTTKKLTALLIDIDITKINVYK